jgi:ABC-type multidrug transport system fused ATPase/permease subunit
VRHFDRILVIRSGKLVQDGAPDELVAQPGPYRDLVRAGERLRRDCIDELDAA